MRRAVLACLMSALLCVACTEDGNTNTSDTGNGGTDTNASVDGAMDTEAPSDTSVAQDTTGGQDSSGGQDTQPQDTGPADSDGDGILDTVEGSEIELDSDGDGTPDYLDTDSDNDGLDDADEVGDPASPIDSDGDATPDFQDPDSDNNGILDGVEGTQDSDGDLLADYLDPDNDNDGALDSLEIFAQGADCNGDGATDPLGSVSQPADCDGDGTPDYLDTDSDNDTITDQQEGSRDTDLDTFLDRYDLDSDNDTLSDNVEAGDDDPNTFPVDTDSDTIPDYRDPDSDGDGLSDAVEAAGGTDPTLEDSDSDGASDLIEVSAGTDPNDGNVNPRTQGDFVFLIPYQEPASPEKDTLAFRTNFQQADVYFLFDRTRSMKGEIDAMRNAVRGIITTLTCTDYGTPCTNDAACSTDQACSLGGSCIDDPSVTGCIPSFDTGTGIYGGSPEIYPIHNLLTPQSDGDITEIAIPVAAGSYGGDEVLFQAAECMADPSRCPAIRMKNCATTGIGCPGFREDAARILIQISDEKNEYVNTTYTADTAGDALSAAGIFYVGIDADPSTIATADMSAIATAAGSLDKTGAPFVRSGDEAAVATAVSSAIQEIVNEVPIRVTIEALEVEGDAGDALPFLDYLEVNVSGADLDNDSTIDCEVISPTEDTDNPTDGYDDAFPSIQPGSRVCWDVHPADNTTVEEAEQAQIFILELVVRGDGAVLDKRRVFFLIPPQPAVIIN